MARERLKNVMIRSQVSPALLQALELDAEKNFESVGSIVATRLTALYKKALPPTHVANARRESAEADVALKRYKLDRLTGNIITVDFAIDRCFAEMQWARQHYQQLIDNLKIVFPDQRDVIDQSHVEALNRISDLDSRLRAMAKDNPPPSRIEDLPAPPQPDFG
jgi:hypothetical protein